jgi:hypothetical protein
VSVEAIRTRGEVLRRRILLASAGVPGVGEGSIVAYTLFQAMQRAGVEARLVLLVEERDLDYLEYVSGGRFGNPKDLPGVECILCAREEDDEPDRDVRTALETARPDVVLAIGTPAAARLLPHVGGTPVLLWATGQIDAPPKRRTWSWPRQPLRDSRYAEILRSPTVWRSWNRAVLEQCRLILAPSPDTVELLLHLYPRWQGKIHPLALHADWVASQTASDRSTGTSWDDRALDVVFVAARWDLESKNLSCIQDLRRRLPDLRLALVGEVISCPEGIECLGLIVDREQYLGVLCDSRVMACPTSAHSAHCSPLEEAAALGCRLVCTPHCGNRLLVPGAHVAESASAAHLEIAIRAALESEPTALERPAVEGFDELLQILAVI